MPNDNYDLVITGGRVIDPETKLDAVRNVGIKGDKIAAVTEKAIQGKETIDAKGHVVCPGFIDTHNHNCAIPFGEKLALRDGVTTPLELEGGVYPVDEWYARSRGSAEPTMALRWERPLFVSTSSTRPTRPSSPATSFTT